MENFKSEQINELALALAKAQSEMLVAGTSSVNPFYKSKYADFATIVRASRPALCKHGLSVSQIISEHGDGAHRLYTMLLHASGQYLSSTVKIAPLKEDPQSLGSYITYMKRYSYAAIVGMTATDEDDDGEAATIPYREQKHAQQPQKTYAREPVVERVSLDQLSELEHVLRDETEITEQVLAGLGIPSLDQMPKSRYRASIDRIREIKAARAL